MSRKESSVQLILEQGLLPLYYHRDRVVSELVLKALYRAGIRSVEYTNRGEAAAANFAALLALRDAELPGLQLGVGTIKTVAEAEAFAAAGADYIICPGWIPGVFHFATARDLLCVPGCMTTSEIIAAEQAGASLVKLFPGNLLGPGYVSAIRDIFPGLHFMPTGGVDTTAENIRSWFGAGVSAVGMGSKLLSKQLLETGDYETLHSLTQQTLTTVQSIRNTI